MTTPRSRRLYLLSSRLEPGLICRDRLSKSYTGNPGLSPGHSSHLRIEAGEGYQKDPVASPASLLQLMNHNPCTTHQSSRSQVPLPIKTVMHDPSVKHRPRLAQLATGFAPSVQKFISQGRQDAPGAVAMPSAQLIQRPCFLQQPAASSCLSAWFAYKHNCYQLGTPAA